MRRKRAKNQRPKCWHNLAYLLTQGGPATGGIQSLEKISTVAFIIVHLTSVLNIFVSMR